MCRERRRETLETRAHPTRAHPLPQEEARMARRARKGRARKKKRANHGKRPTAR
ncbi:hypothetical protein GCM10010149_08160 [Nonomuraea roseoviolacea subsp. roseoviolacea]